MTILEGEILPPNAVSMAPHGRHHVSVQFVLPDHCVHISDIGGQCGIYFVLDNESARQLARMAENAVNGVRTNTRAN